MKTVNYRIVGDDLVWINPELKEFTIPDGVKIVSLKDEPYSLRDESCNDIKLEKIVFSTTVESVKEYAFLNCKRLNKIVLKNLTINYDDHAFATCYRWTGPQKRIDELTFEIQSEDGLVSFYCYKDSYKEFPFPKKINYLFKSDNDILVYFFSEDMDFTDTFDAIVDLNKNCLINFEVANESNNNDTSVCNILNTLYEKCDYSFLVFKIIIMFLYARSESSYNSLSNEDYYKYVKQELLNVLNNLEKKVHVSETIVNIFSNSYDNDYNIVDDDSNFMHLTKYFDENKYYNKSSDIRNEFKKMINDACLRSLYDMLYTSKDSSEILKEFVLGVKDVYNQIENKIIEGIKSDAKKREMIIDKIILKRS